MYKSVHGIAPTHLCNANEMVCDRHNLNTRAADKTNVILPKPNLECFKNSLMYSGGVIWNLLPINLQNSTSISSFKYLYKSCTFINVLNNQYLHGCVYIYLFYPTLINTSLLVLFFLTLFQIILFVILGKPLNVNLCV